MKFQLNLLTGELPVRYAVRTDEVFEKIKASHKACEHGGVNKTWGIIKERYFGKSLN